jgi:16S rRNA processing protein RimM
MDAAAFIPLGRVAKTHGLHGEVSVVMTANLPVERLAGLEVWFVPPPVTLRTARIESVRPGPKGPLFTLSGVGRIDDADLLRGCTLLVRAADVPDFEPEWDPTGMRVVDEERGELGEIVDVIVTGANDVWVVEGELGQVLIPAIESVVIDTDDETGIVRVRLLPGLVDDK